MALVPQANATPAGWGLSASATPTLWFYSPYETDSPLQAAAEVTDEAGEVIWQSSDIQLPSQPGIFGYQIPPEANLQSGNTYRWYLTVQIDPEQPAADVILNARLTYQSAPQSVDLSSPLSVEEIQSLASQGLWYDTVTAIAQASQDNWFLWEQFLIKNGFPEIIKAPIHPSSSVKPN